MTSSAAELATIAAVVAVLAGSAQAVTGFGLALVAIPLLTVVSDGHIAVVAVTMTSACVTSFASIRERRHVNIPTFVRVGAASICGMPLGLVALSFASGRQLSILIGVLVLIMVVVFLKPQLPYPRRPVFYAMGGLSGAMLTSTGINGPPVVGICRAARMSRRSFRATLQSVFFVQDLCATIGFIYIGQVNTDSLTAFVGGIPGVLLGWLIGDRLFARIPPTLFRVIVLGVMASSGGIALISSIA